MTLSRDELRILIRQLEKEHGAEQGLWPRERFVLKVLFDDGAEQIALAAGRPEPVLAGGPRALSGPRARAAARRRRRGVPVTPHILSGRCGRNATCRRSG
jgi:hypothetical protein